MDLITSITNSLAQTDAILSLHYFVQDSSKENGAPDYYTACHIHEQWQSVLFAFPSTIEA